MFKTTFNPGPSQLSPATKQDIDTAVAEKMLEISHRSSAFSSVSKHCITELRKLLHIPGDYKVFYLDSATQAWHSILCNSVAEKSFHFVNGAFSGKFHQAAKKLNKQAIADEVEWGSQNNFKDTSIPPDTELITVCANETSTGVQLPMSDLQYICKNKGKALLAVDMTSCAGLVDLPIELMDMAYFSVQKAFGLPAGLGILIVSPTAFERSVALAQAKQNLAGIWQWETLEKCMTEKNYQTPQTPNVFNIYLLAQQTQRWNQAGGLEVLVAQTKAKMKTLQAWVEAHPDLDFFVQNPQYRSDTVLTVKADSEIITAFKASALHQGIQLGGGYGKTKHDVFRLANFPAISTNEIQHLMHTLS